MSIPASCNRMGEIPKPWARNKLAGSALGRTVEYPAMNAEQSAKIESALGSCLEECRATDRPYTRVSEFIAGLQGDPEWTPSEIIELQTRIIRVLLYRNGRPEGTQP
jgi:hypothetical protein